MKKFNTLLTLMLATVFFVFTSLETVRADEKTPPTEKHEWKTKTSNGYTYKYVTNDPSNARFYTLDNGLTVILSPINKAPRIQAYIAVKAGSKTDPADHTGLAHYLEHMMFKGTQKYGSADWAKEKPLIDKITALYEEYNSTEDEAKRTKIYHRIDSVSGIAAHYAIANEYDKMMSGMGAQGTNAFTSFEETVYTENIPSNVIDKFLKVQSERFKDPVFRLFHTELEAVYEEKNRTLDNDGRKVIQTMFEQLFKNNNYGKQTTIGTIHDLKNPSLIEIRKYYNTYYVPNNMGVIMSGDFDPDEVIEKIDHAFSYMKPKQIPPYTFDPEKPITTPINKEVFGPEPARLMIGYRFPGANSKDAKMLQLVGEILTNGSAGLIDLDLVKKQKLLGASAFPYILKDYSALLISGNPNGDQDLDDVKSLLLGEISKLKSGDFSEDVITSIINNEKKSVLRTSESYGGRARELMNNFTLDGDWAKDVNYVNWLGTVTKQDVMNFANKYFKNNYVAVYKRQGKDQNVQKVEKPAITPVDVNRDEQSPFLQEVSEMSENKIQPVWLNYKKDIDKAEAGKYPVLAVKNKDNELFQMQYEYKTGSWGSKLLPIAIGYLDYLGTKDRSSEDFSKAFYKLASSFNTRVSSRNSSVVMSGLQENMQETVKLVDDLMRNAVADQGALDSYIKRLKKSRANAKENKERIKAALQSYAFYGSKNPFNNVLTDEELDNLKAEQLVGIIHKLANAPHRILYYGPESANKLASTMAKIHKAPATFSKLPENKDFKEQPTTTNKVLLAHYDMVQAEVFWVRNSDKYNPEMAPSISFFNQYFGGGMESIVFQTIRESKALAYSTYAYYVAPSRKNEHNSFLAYIGAQADKFPEAIDGMNELLTNLPRADKNVENAKKSIRKKLASQRINGMGIISSYLAAQRLGIDYDQREKIYKAIPGMSFTDLQSFFSREIKGKPYTYTILAGKGKLDQQKLNSLGEVKVLSLDELFGY